MRASSSLGVIATHLRHLAPQMAAVGRMATDSKRPIPAVRDRLELLRPVQRLAKALALMKVLVFFLAALLSSCASVAPEMVLELKDTQFFQAHQTSSAPTKIDLTGLAFHSSMAVRNITVVQHGSTSQILVHLTAASTGLSGNFRFIFSVPPATNDVRFGNEKTLIWTRAEGMVKMLVEK